MSVSQFNENNLKKVILTLLKINKPHILQDEYFDGEYFFPIHQPEQSNFWRMYINEFANITGVSVELGEKTLQNLNCTNKSVYAYTDVSKFNYTIFDMQKYIFALLRYT